MKVLKIETHDEVIRALKQRAAAEAKTLEVVASEALMAYVAMRLTPGLKPSSSSIDSRRTRLASRAEQLAAESRPFEVLTLEERNQRLESIMGIGQDIMSTSDEFARQKQGEIELEDLDFDR